MKHLRFSAPVLLVVICVLLSTSASQSASNKPAQPTGAIFANSLSDGGRVYIRRSPVLGKNVYITLMIDGQVGGTLMWGHTYDKFLTPGRHVLVASPNGRGDPARLELDVRQGHTYAFTASYNVSKLILTPVVPTR